MRIEGILQIREALVSGQVPHEASGDDKASLIKANPAEAGSAWHHLSGYAVGCVTQGRGHGVAILPNASWERLKARSAIRKPERVRQAAAVDPAALFAFDLLWLNGADFRQRRLLERKAALHRLLPANRRIRYAGHFLDCCKELWTLANEHELEASSRRMRRPTRLNALHAGAGSASPARAELEGLTVARVAGYERLPAMKVSCWRRV